MGIEPTPYALPRWGLPNGAILYSAEAHRRFSVHVFEIFAVGWHSISYAATHSCPKNIVSEQRALGNNITSQRVCSKPQIARHRG